VPSTDIATVDASNPDLLVEKTNFVIGNDVQFQRTVVGLIAPDAPIAAWLTIKTSPAQQDISGAQVPIGLSPTSFGQIVGSLCVFNLKAGQTARLKAGPLYYYDIKVQVTPSGDIYTVEQGYIQFQPMITDAPLNLVTPAQNLPPSEPFLQVGHGSPQGGVMPMMIGARFWDIDASPGDPCAWVNVDGTVNGWHVTEVVADDPAPGGGPPVVVVTNLLMVVFGPSPPPNGLVVPQGTRYWVTPPVPGLPAEYVAIDSNGTWRATSVVAD
jgi:hypothetical protein